MGQGPKSERSVSGAVRRRLGFLIGYGGAEAALAGGTGYTLIANVRNTHWAGRQGWPYVEGRWVAAEDR